MTRAAVALAVLAWGCLVLASTCAPMVSRVNPNLQLWTSLSIPPEVIARDVLTIETGERVPVARVKLFARILSPNPWPGSRIDVTVTNGKVFHFPRVADDSWSLEGPFGVGRHTLRVDVIREDTVLHSYTVAFRVFPPESGL